MGEVNLKVPAVGWAAFDSSGHLGPFSFKRRECGPKDVKFSVKFCGVCHSDLHLIKNEWGHSMYPMVPGHEAVGVVTETGSEVTKFKVGDYAGVGCLVNSCRNCENCKKDLENYCLQKLIMTYGDQDVDGTVTYGGYSNFMVANEDFVLKIPKNLPLDSGAPLLCAGITIYSAMKQFDMEKGGKNFGVIGLGGLGHIAVKLAKAFGMNVTVLSTNPDKEKEARELLKADNFIVSKDETQMKTATATLDFIIDTVSVSHPIDPYLALLKTSGKLILVGITTSQLEISPSFIMLGRRTVGGSVIGGIAETQEMLDFCAEHNVTCEIETIPISYVNTAMKRLMNSDVRYRFVIDIENSLKH